MNEGDGIRLVSCGDDNTWTISTKLHNEQVNAQKFEEELKGLAKRGIISFRKDKQGTFLVRSLVGPFVLSVSVR